MLPVQTLASASAAFSAVSLIVWPVAAPLAVRSKTTLSGLMPSALFSSAQVLVTETETFSASPVKTFTKLARPVWFVVATLPVVSPKPEVTVEVA